MEKVAVDSHKMAMGCLPCMASIRAEDTIDEAPLEPCSLQRLEAHSGASLHVPFVRDLVELRRIGTTARCHGSRHRPHEDFGSGGRIVRLVSAPSHLNPSR